MRTPIAFGLAVACAVAILPAAAGAQTSSRCASCHFANLERVPAADWLGDWAQSPHARHGVGCERCHGGDALTEQPQLAHRGVLPAANPDSPVHPGNLAATCAGCHRANANAFEGSRHQTLIDLGDTRAPTCATCHGIMRARTISPTELEARCATCHPADLVRVDNAAVMRAALETLEDRKSVV